MGGTDDQKEPDDKKSQATPEQKAKELLRLNPDATFPSEEMYVQIGEGRLYEEAYKELCETITGKAPADTPPPSDDFVEEVLKYLGRRRDEFHRLICVEFDYCGKKKKYGANSRFLKALLGLLIVILESATLGTASAAWLLSEEVLDRFCECDKKK